MAYLTIGRCQPWRDAESRLPAAHRVAAHVPRSSVAAAQLLIDAAHLVG